MTYVLEPCPPNAPWGGPAGQEAPCYGGRLFFHQETGIAGCQHCGWSGVPHIRDGIISTRCLACELAPATDLLAAEDRFWSLGQVRQRQVTKVARNAPCPCGSGVKAKKCGCEEYAA